MTRVKKRLPTAKTAKIRKPDEMGRFPIKRKGSNIPLIFGILNLSSDSFSGDVGKGRARDVEYHVARTLEMFSDGADAIDVGAESTRPGAGEMAPDEETELLLPVIRGIRKVKKDAVISVDTRKSVCAKASLKAGADLINDVSGLAFDEAMAGTVAEADAGLIIMHSRGLPENMQKGSNLIYGDVVKEVADFLMKKALYAEKCGVKHEKIMLDPGIGFAKDLCANLALLRSAKEFLSLPYPILYGVSRKSFLGQLCGREVPSGRDFATSGIHAFLTLAGVDAVRVHNVAAARDAMLAAAACSEKTKN